MSPRVSVLLPVWNGAATLETALRSISRQTVSDWECVIVDDGSTDASGELARAAAARDPRFRVVSRRHAGIVEALRAGTAYCRAPFVARLDADDWMHRDRLHRQLERLEHDSDLLAVGCAVRIFPRSALGPGRRAYERWLNSLVDPASIWRDRFVECPIAHPTLMIRRSVLGEIGGYQDRGWPEDYDLLLRLLRRGPVVGTVPTRLIGWRDGPERLSRNDPRCGQDRLTACRTWYLARDFLAGHRRIVLCGYGGTGRALRKALRTQGIATEAIIDVHPGRIGNRVEGIPVFPPEALREGDRRKIVVSLAGAERREAARALLDGWGYREGFDYICAA